MNLLNSFSDSMVLKKANQSISDADYVGYNTLLFHIHGGTKFHHVQVNSLSSPCIRRETKSSRKILLDDYISGRKRTKLDPEHDEFRNAFNYYWVEAKIGDRWTDWNTTDRPENLRDNISEKVVEIMMPDRVIVPEIEIVKNRPLFSYCFKNSVEL